MSQNTNQSATDDTWVFTLYLVRHLFSNFPHAIRHAQMRAEASAHQTYVTTLAPIWILPELSRQEEGN